MDHRDAARFGRPDGLKPDFERLVLVNEEFDDEDGDPDLPETIPAKWDYRQAKKNIEAAERALAGQGGEKMLFAGELE